MQYGPSTSLRHLFSCHHTACPITQGWVSDQDPCPYFCASEFHLSQSLCLPLPFLLSSALCICPCGSSPRMPLTVPTMSAIDSAPRDICAGWGMTLSEPAKDFFTFL